MARTGWGLTRGRCSFGCLFPVNGRGGSGASNLEAADALCEVLRRLDVQHVFGLPGTQNMDFTEAIRRSPLDWVVPSNELAASFAANGYWRASGRPAVMNTIPGPGFTWALSGLAEARLDSTAVVLLTGAHPSDGRGGRLQEIPQARMAAPIVKETLRASSAGELPGIVERAHGAAIDGEPGPVLLEIEHPVWDGRCRLPERSNSVAPESRRPEWLAGKAPKGAVADPVEEIRRRLEAATRPLLFVGQGAQESAGEVTRLAETLSAPVLLTTSGRGVLPESHPLAVPLDRLPEPIDRANRLLEASDLVLVLGCRLGHNATLGHRLELPPDRLVRVDASRHVLGDGRYGGSLRVVADVGHVVRCLLSERSGPGAPDIGDDSGGSWSEGMSGEAESGNPSRDRDAPSSEPRIEGMESMAAFFRALRRVVPDDGILVTDSGLHQMIVRRYWSVEAPRTLVVPTNFQSMGYGIPAAIGAGLANPGRKVVAVIGDGGLRLSAFDLTTARALGLDLCVIVFADGFFGLIRQGQLDAYGHGSGVDLPEVDIQGLCRSLGVEHEALEREPRSALRKCVTDDGVRVLEVGVTDPAGRRVRTARARLRQGLRRGLGPERVEGLRDWLTGLSDWTGASDDDS